METLEVGALADAQYIKNLYGDVGTLRGVIVSVAEPHSRFNTLDKRTVSVSRHDGSASTSSSTLPVTVVAAAGSPEARAAVRELLASGKRLTDRQRAALGALA